jgi:hypothetical protein
MKRCFAFSLLLLLCGCGIKPQAETWEARKLRTINALKKYKEYGYEKNLIAVQAFAQTDAPRLCQAFVVQNGAPEKFLLVLYWIADVPDERAITIAIKDGPTKTIPFQDIVIEAYKKMRVQPSSTTPPWMRRSILN